MTDIYLVSVDTRGKGPSDISGYKEHTASLSYFNNVIKGHPDAVCYRCKVAKLCGLDMKVYFHNTAENSRFVDEENDQINRAATLLTLNPTTGLAEHSVKGVAYVVLNNGMAPLSQNQVWGIQELINYAKDTYEANPHAPKKGHKDLMKACKLYQYQQWGPMSIYLSRTDIMETDPVPVRKSKPSDREPFKQIQT